MYLYPCWPLAVHSYLSEALESSMDTLCFRVSKSFLLMVLGRGTPLPLTPIFCCNILNLSKKWWLGDSFIIPYDNFNCILLFLVCHITSTFNFYWYSQIQDLSDSIIPKLSAFWSIYVIWPFLGIYFNKLLINLCVYRGGRQNRQ